MSEHTIRVQRNANGLAWLEWRRPKGNVLTTALLEDVGAKLRELAEDPQLRLVVLRGADGVFSYGASVEEHRREQAPSMLRAFHGFIRALVDLNLPVGAFVEGQCLGGAFEVVLACSFVFATEDARLGCPEVRLGVFPPVLAALGPCRLPGAAVERLVVGGEALPAPWFERLGLVTAIVPGGDDGVDAIRQWYAKRLEPLSGWAVREALSVTREASGLRAAARDALARAEERYVREVLASHDGNEGIEAFLARRKPQWTHR